MRYQGQRQRFIARVNDDYDLDKTKRWAGDVTQNPILTMKSMETIREQIKQGGAAGTHHILRLRELATRFKQEKITQKRLHMRLQENEKVVHMEALEVNDLDSEEGYDVEGNRESDSDHQDPYEDEVKLLHINQPHP